MIPFIIAAIPIEVEPYQEYHPNDWTEINRLNKIIELNYYYGSKRNSSKVCKWSIDVQV